MLSQTVHIKNLSQIYSKKASLGSALEHQISPKEMQCLISMPKPNRPIKHYIAYELIKSSKSHHHPPIKLD